MTALLCLGRGQDGELPVRDGFSGAGGSSSGLKLVPGLRIAEAINHDTDAVRVHGLNFPDAEHVQTDIQRLCVSRRKPAAFSWDSPACPHWTDAAGRPMWFDKSNQYVIPGLEPRIADTAIRSRALMEEVPLYLEAMWLAGFPVLAGCVENVPQVRKWDQWSSYLNRFHMLGYKTKLIALNSAHVIPVRANRCPQSRNRAYLAYWLEALGRDPDWDKWLRPRAFCPRCDKVVWAIQSFKNPRVDMGVYGVKNGQYVYRCPDVRCRGQVVEPEVVGAHTVIDFTKPIKSIGKRPKPLSPLTMARIGAGIVKYGQPVLTPAGGTWRSSATPVADPMPTRTTRETDGLAVPPLVVTLRGGGSVRGARTLDKSMPTLTASGNHVGVVDQPRLDMLVPYNRTGKARPSTEPMGTLTTHDRFGAASAAKPLKVDPDAIARAVEAIEIITKTIQSLKNEDKARKSRANAAEIARLKAEAQDIAAGMGLEDVLFRMLDNEETHKGMAFNDDFVMPGDLSTTVVRRLYGNAVTPPVSEVIGSALVETIFGIELERAL